MYPKTSVSNAGLQTQDGEKGGPVSVKNGKKRNKLKPSLSLSKTWWLIPVGLPHKPTGLKSKILVSRLDFFFLNRKSCSLDSFFWSKAFESRLSKLGIGKNRGYFLLHLMIPSQVAQNKHWVGFWLFCFGMIADPVFGVVSKTRHGFWWENEKKREIFYVFEL